MSDYEAFVHELIGYIFKVQDKDDDNLSAEIICRKLYKYGLIENVNHEWRMKYRPKHRWPATVHNGRADKEDWQSYTIDRKTENCSEKPNNCEDAENPSGDVWECGCFLDTYCEHQIYDRNPDGTINIVECGYEPKTEPQTETQTETQNSNLTFEKRTMRDCYNCKRYETEEECVECHYESKDEAQTERSE